MLELVPGFDEDQNCSISYGFDCGMCVSQMAAVGHHNRTQVSNNCDQYPWIAAGNEMRVSRE
jgi:hypothetical protein